MPPKPFEIYRQLRKEGWRDEGCKGSHCKLKKGDKTIVLPLHRAEIKKGLWERIRKDAGWRS
ncbi:MAG: type II toxin-antitoxin system HicA family toxin [Gordonibacter sp.]|uniref:type II toxin-antitoxin system HicA family toxin n=1 Tax=Gordonibacter sp. TaxID=1968902 RepID=UPI002FC83579